MVSYMLKSHTWFKRVVLLVSFVVLLNAPLTAGQGKCIKGQYHKDIPGSEVGNFKTCKPYESNACCTANFTVELAATRTEKLYNHTWDLCKNLSSSCEKFWIEQECFYQCSPNVYEWKHSSVKGGLHGVPICSSYCNAWFDACKSDHICVDDVLTGFDFSAHGANSCPANSSCTTYADRFKNGAGLCNKMWNTSYVFTVENADKSNCMVMTFNGTNPNSRVPKPTPKPTAPGPTAPGPTAGTKGNHAACAMVLPALMVALYMYVLA